MSEKKSFWAKLKGWVDGEEVILNADEYIATREREDEVVGEKMFGEKHANAENFRSNSRLYHVLCVAVTVCFIVVMLIVLRLCTTELQTSQREMLSILSVFPKRD